MDKRHDGTFAFLFSGTVPADSLFIFFPTDRDEGK
jgi:hypothetical protein